MDALWAWLIIAVVSVSIVIWHRLLFAALLYLLLIMLFMSDD